MQLCLRSIVARQNIWTTSNIQVRSRTWDLLGPSRFAMILSGPTVDIVPLEATHTSALWAATLAGNTENARLFAQTYGVECVDLESFTRIIWQGWREDDYIPFVTISRASRQPLNWPVLHSNNFAVGGSIKCARFLEDMLRTEQQLEAAYLVMGYIFAELQCDVVSVRQGTLESRNPMLRQSTLLGSFRRSLFVPEQSQISDLYVLTKEQWPAVKAAAEAWAGIPGEGDESTSSLPIERAV